MFKRINIFFLRQTRSTSMKYIEVTIGYKQGQDLYVNKNKELGFLNIQIYAFYFFLKIRTKIQLQEQIFIYRN